MMLNTGRYRRRRVWRGPMKVLVADDDPVSRRLLQSYLQKWGYEVVVAGDHDFVSKPIDRDEHHVRLRAGEQIIKLERALEDQNRALREAQAALLKTADRPVE